MLEIFEWAWDFWNSWTWFFLSMVVTVFVGAVQQINQDQKDAEKVAEKG